MTGEKFAYYTYLILGAIKKGFIPKMVGYDIACRLAPSLRKFEPTIVAILLAAVNKFGATTGAEMPDASGPTTVAGIKFALGRFHAWAHQSRCHIQWSAQFQEGFGMGDLEDLERFWSLLQKHAGQHTFMFMCRHTITHTNTHTGTHTHPHTLPLPGPTS